MRRLLPLLAVLLVQACGPKDRTTILCDDTVTIPPRELFYKSIELPIGGSFTMTVTPDGGGLEVWSQPGKDQPYVEYENPPRPGCLIIPSGQEGKDAATLGWGHTTFVIFNRNLQPVKAKVRLAVLSNER